MRPDPDDIYIYEYFREKYNWSPSMVDKQDAVIMDKFLIMDEHRALIKKPKAKTDG